ncbi:tRNA sulfurtransferase [Flexistipes sinusarabici DSM 4947]|uniref:Probable tRNA sulfurtransferase n=1 Tax=Flexistipes sinusarabici (strain ATCC 49648 / DSM 4947 / MAS 10) TaxID=717231 RepID=F8EA18_FLESM|nr:tRNA uracil 4-sulfurtransferase ThiI [Flexistipes sinusarabici]AEI15429.1 tRNA sulfurtransferase [Flexistipes sinusarabici DSM 4947]
MKKCLLISVGELILKGKNRNIFENTLIKKIKEKAETIGPYEFKKYRARYAVIAETDDANLQELILKFRKIFGITVIFQGYVVSRDIDSIKKSVLKVAEKNSTFKIRSKRHDKSYSIKSLDLNREIGEFVLSEVQGTSVDVHNPKQVINIEIFEDSVIVFTEAVRGMGGLPYGTAGRVVSLFSGGIDSPVASWMMMKRGCEIIPVHFHTPPYTGEGSILKVKDLIKHLADFAGKPLVSYFVNFTSVQLAVKKCVPDKYVTVVSRRFMGRIAEEIASLKNAKGIVTGEALAQVASQTLENMLCVDGVFGLTVLRPLVGLDKEEIVKKARYIGTYDISIRKEVDCCHLFVPKRPETKANIAGVCNAEKKVFEQLGTDWKYDCIVEKIG